MKKSSPPPMIFFFLVLILYNLAANFAHPVTPTLIKVYHLSDYMFGVAFAAMQTTNFLFSPFWGKLSGYISSRMTLLICGCGYACGQLLFFMAHTEGLIIAARCISGFFISGASVACLIYVVNTSSDMERGRNLTILATIQSVGAAFGYLIGGFLGEFSLGAAFLPQVFCLASSGLLFFLFCRDDRRPEIASQPLTRSTLVRDANPFAAFMQSRQFMTALFAILFTVTALQNLGYTAYDQCFNYFIKDQFGFTSAYNGAIKGVIGFISLVANATICMSIIRRGKVNRSVAYVLMACTLTIFAVLFLDEMRIPFLVVNVVFYAFNAVSIPLLQDMVAKKAEGNDSNLVMGFYNATKSLGGIIGSLTAGFLYAKGASLSFVFAGIVLLLATLFAFVYQRKNAPSPLSARR